MSQPCHGIVKREAPCLRAWTEGYPLGHTAVLGNGEASAGPLLGHCTRRYKPIGEELEDVSKNNGKTKGELKNWGFFF